MEEKIMDSNTMGSHIKEWKLILKRYEGEPESTVIDYRIKAVKRLIAQYSPNDKGLQIDST